MIRRAISLLLLSACARGELDATRCSAPDAEGFELFYALTGEVGALAGGATPNEEIVVSRDGVELGRAIADQDGRFRAGISAIAGELIEVERADRAPVSFCVRDADEARRDAVLPSIDGAGNVPNDLIIAGSRAVLVRSGDNAVGVFDLSRGLDGAMLGVRLPDSEDGCGPHSANPWFAAAIDERRVAVTAYGQGRVYIVDLDRGEVESTLVMSRSISLDEPIQVPREIDAQCDGTTESEVTSFVPRTPQAIAVAGRSLVVAFTSFVWHQPPIFLPGTLGVWSLDDLGGPSVIELGAYNPQELRVIDDRRVLVVASGVIDPSGDRVRVSSPGSVLIADVTTGVIEQRYELGEYAPGTALIAGDSLWVGSLAHGSVRRIDLQTGETLAELELSSEPIDSVFRLVELPGGLIGAPSFDTDRLFVIDAARGELSPAPFLGPLQLGPGQPIPDGLQIVARRGFELFALSGPASRVRPIALRKVLGP